MIKKNMEIGSSKKNIEKVEAFLLQCNEDFKIPEAQFHKLLIAVSEIIINSILHGNKQQEHKKICVTVCIEGSDFIVKVTDEGNEFDINNIPDPTVSENLLKNSGRGIFIARQLVDDFKYDHTGKGSEFTLIMRKKE